VAEVAATAYSESQRTELRALVRLAGEIVAYYWPMRTFVHHNPLHGLEDLPFETAVDRGRQRLGGKGYLSNEKFRDYFRSGRILPRHIDAQLRRRVEDRPVEIAGRKVNQLEVLRAHMIEGLSFPRPEFLDLRLEREPDRGAIIALADYLSPVLPPETGGDLSDSHKSERNPLLAACCDRLLGTEIAGQINREMIKWCAAFLDEGHATWPMPAREKGFYEAWKLLAQREWSPCRIENQRAKLASLPAKPEDAVMDALAALGVPPEAWQDYLSRHLTALPGWTGFIKWRADQSEYEWQLAYPIDLVQYAAVRLWYERELAQSACRAFLGIDARFDALCAAIQKREGRASSRALPNPASLGAAWRLTSLARALKLDPSLLAKTARENLLTLLEWLEAFPESEHGALWLKALEAGYREELLHKLRGGESVVEIASDRGQDMDGPGVRPQAQAIFCIDVRSEPFRRHLEAIGDYETYGFAGFFALFIRHQALGSHHETDQFPVIMKSKNVVREIPRTYHGRFLFRHRRRTRLLAAGHTLLYDLKENVVTPYVMVESLGWFYSLPFIGKTFCATWYRVAADWLRHKLVPPVATTLTVDKLGREEVAEMLAAEQRAVTRRALRERFGDRHLNLSLERLDYLRRRALDEENIGEPSPRARSTALSPEEEAGFIDALRQEYGVNGSTAFARMERITRTGFTLGEQVFTVETALRMMGLTQNFARLVLLCGHGSRSENNPFEAALDCGACGGNSGRPNARLFAAMANKPAVREELGKKGIVIPQDTFFIAGQHYTTTDDVELFDLEDLPPTHRKDLLQLLRDLEQAGARTSRERCARFPEINRTLSLAKAKREVRRRSADWSQVRPEWGLSGNAAFIIGRRALTRGVQLDGRVFLHSYDYRLDPDGRLLEVVMTGPQVVGQWINMEHYFSTVDREVYGSGSKIYHNVVGRLGVMSGPQSDLRTGLAWQTVMNGEHPYHEPMRLLTVIEAPKQSIERIIGNHRVLQHFYDNRWVSLIAVDPEEKSWDRYAPGRGWKRIPLERPCAERRSV
jgi:hypothetical protein